MPRFTSLTDSQNSVPLKQQLLKLEHRQVLDAVHAVDEVQGAVKEGEAGLREGTGGRGTTMYTGAMRENYSAMRDWLVGVFYTGNEVHGVTEEGKEGPRRGGGERGLGNNSVRGSFEYEKAKMPCAFACLMLFTLQRGGRPCRQAAHRVAIVEHGEWGGVGTPY